MVLKQELKTLQYPWGVWYGCHDIQVDISIFFVCQIKNHPNFCWCLCNEFLMANVWTNEGALWNQKREQKEENDAILIFFIWYITLRQ